MQKGVRERPASACWVGEIGNWGPTTVSESQMAEEMEFRAALALPTNSALPPNEKVFRDCLNEICKQTISRGLMPHRIEIDCKRSGPQTAPKKKFTATLFMKAYTKEGYFR